MFDGWGFSAGAVWLSLAVLLGLAELVAPGVFLVFLAIAAAITGVAMLALPDLPVAAQVASFAVWSTVAVMIGRRWYRDYPVASTDPLLNDRAARMIGSIVRVEDAIAHGAGRVRIGDSVWPARGPEAGVGEHVRIVGVESGVVVVEAVGDPSGLPDASPQ